MLSMHSGPLVSVCIPTYNYGKLIPDAVRSVLSQSCSDFELIIVDNASTDATADLIKTFTDSDPRIRFFRNAVNVGIVKNFNLALQYAKGRFVKMLCADDLLAPSALEKSLALIQSDPAVSLVTTGRLLVDSRLRPVGYLSYCSKGGSTDGGKVIDRCLFGTNYVGEPSAVLFRREQALPGFDESYPHLLDLAMWFRLLEQGKLACTPEPLVYIRQHKDQVTKDNRRTGQVVQDKKRILSAYLTKPYVRKTALRLFIWRLRAAYNVWRGSSADDVGRRINEFLPPACFYALLPAIVVTDWLRSAAIRARSIRHARRAPVKNG